MNHFGVRVSLRCTPYCFGKVSSRLSPLGVQYNTLVLKGKDWRSSESFEWCLVSVFFKLRCVAKVCQHRVMHALLDLGFKEILVDPMAHIFSTRMSDHDCNLQNRFSEGCARSTPTSWRDALDAHVGRLKILCSLKLYAVPILIQRALGGGRVCDIYPKCVSSYSFRSVKSNSWNLVVAASGLTVDVSIQI